MQPADSISSCTAVFVAAGSGRRMGFDKLAALMKGVPVLCHALLAFENAASISEIIVVCPEERWKLLDGIKFTKPIRRVDGGAERQDSVAAGLSLVTTPYVAVHDAARPMVSPADIDRCVCEAVQHRAASLARRVTETVKRADDEDYIVEAVARHELWFMETPQVFQTELLRDAYQKITAHGLHVTDENSAVQHLGVRVKLVESTKPNFKITTPADLTLAEALMR